MPVGFALSSGCFVISPTIPSVMKWAKRLTLAELLTPFQLENDKCHSDHREESGDVWIGPTPDS
ncbi:MAG: hypothetical protein J4N81_01955, partial [Chloroflexi bacterium]|nr:hypothetical protein [Chloroflexota bacterium]MCI0857475.1 hypothetical protein [Chloroflexota bacterium]